MQKVSYPSLFLLCVESVCSFKSLLFSLTDFVCACVCTLSFVVCMCACVCFSGDVWLSRQQQGGVEPEEGRGDLPAATSQCRLAGGKNGERKRARIWEGREKERKVEKERGSERVGEWKPEKAGWRVRGRGGKIKKRWRWRWDGRKEEEVFFYVERGGVFIGSILGKVRNKNRRAKDQSGAMKRDGIRETSREGKWAIQLWRRVKKRKKVMVKWWLSAFNLVDKK